MSDYAFKGGVSFLRWHVSIFEWTAGVLSVDVTDRIPKYQEKYRNTAVTFSEVETAAKVWAASFSEAMGLDTFLWKTVKPRAKCSQGAK